MGGIDCPGAELPRTPPPDPFRQAAKLAIPRMRAKDYRAALAAAMTRPRKPFDLMQAVERMFAERQEIERVSRAHYQARIAGQAGPEIGDAIVRHYAYVLGQTLDWRDNAPTREHRQVHERAIESFHSCIRDWRNTREVLGLGSLHGPGHVREALAGLGPAERTALNRRLHVWDGAQPA